MLKLFYSPGAVALASHIALEESGLDYETVRISFGDNEQRAPEYLKINPKGRVPSLVTDRGILTETPAILVYICLSWKVDRWASYLMVPYLLWVSFATVLNYTYWQTNM